MRPAMCREAAQHVVGREPASDERSIHPGERTIVGERLAAAKTAGEDGFELVTTLGRPARMGRLVADLYSGPTSRFDLGNIAVVDLAFGTLASVTDVALFSGANALAVEVAGG